MRPTDLWDRFGDILGAVAIGLIFASVLYAPEALGYLSTLVTQ